MVGATAAQSNLADIPHFTYCLALILFLSFSLPWVMQGGSSGSCKLGYCAHCCLSQLIVAALNSCILYSVSVFGTQCFVNCITFSGYYLILLCNTIKRERRKSSGFEKTNIQPSSTPLRDLNHITLYLMASMLSLGIRFAWRCCVMSSGDIRSVRNACKVFLAASWSAAEMSLVCFIGSFLKLPGLRYRSGALELKFGVFYFVIYFDPLPSVSYAFPHITSIESCLPWPDAACEYPPKFLSM